MSPIYTNTIGQVYVFQGSAVCSASSQPVPPPEPELAPHGDGVNLFFDKVAGTQPFYFDKFQIRPNDGQTASAQIISGKLTYEGGSRSITTSEKADLMNGLPVTFFITPSGHSMPATITNLSLKLNLYGSPSSIYFENQASTDIRSVEVSATMNKPYYNSEQDQGYYIWLPYAYGDPRVATKYVQSASSTHTMQIRTDPWVYPVE